MHFKTQCVQGCQKHVLNDAPTKLDGKLSHTALIMEEAKGPREAVMEGVYAR